MSEAMMFETKPGIRASDADREQVATLLADHFADGRLTQPEFDERLSVAYAARTYDQLREVVADLPAPQPPVEPAGAVVAEPWLHCLLWCVFPPAGLAYWLLTRKDHQDD